MSNKCARQTKASLEFVNNVFTGLFSSDGCFDWNRKKYNKTESCVSPLVNRPITEEEGWDWETIYTITVHSNDDFK